MAWLMGAGFLIKPSRHANTTAARHCVKPPITLAQHLRWPPGAGCRAPVAGCWAPVAGHRADLAESEPTRESGRPGPRQQRFDRFAPIVFRRARIA